MTTSINTPQDHIINNNTQEGRPAHHVDRGKRWNPYYIPRTYIDRIAQLQLNAAKQTRQFSELIDPPNATKRSISRNAPITNDSGNELPALRDISPEDFQPDLVDLLLDMDPSLIEQGVEGIFANLLKSDP